MEITNENAERGKVFRDLRKLVSQYAAASPIKSVGPKQLYYKSALIICGWALTYASLLYFGPKNLWFGALCFPILLLLTCGLEFCIMHDASHKAFSRKGLINKLALNGALSVLGGCSFSWHQEHVVRHHGHTNILGSDPDVYASHVLRLHPQDASYWWHQWQHYYAIPLYSLMWIHWMFNDFVNVVFNTYQLTKKKLLLFFVLVLMGLVPHFILGLYLPYLFFNDIWLVSIGYLVFFMSLSVIMAITFVLAHVADGQNFYLPEEECKDWALHQLETTTDFAVENRFLTWLLGGLNFQVEHHIFPSVCHLHYPEIQKIIKKYCIKNKIAYREHKTLWDAIRSHLAHLKALSVPAKKDCIASGVRLEASES